MSYAGVRLRFDHDHVGTTFGSFFFVDGDEVVGAVSESAVYMRCTSSMRLPKVIQRLGLEGHIHLDIPLSYFFIYKKLEKGCCITFIFFMMVIVSIYKKIQIRIPYTNILFWN